MPLFEYKDFFWDRIQNSLGIDQALGFPAFSRLSSAVMVRGDASYAQTTDSCSTAALLHESCRLPKKKGYRTWMLLNVGGIWDRLKKYYTQLWVARLDWRRPSSSLSDSRALNIMPYWTNNLRWRFALHHNLPCSDERLGRISSSWNYVQIREQTGFTTFLEFRNAVNSVRSQAQKWAWLLVDS